MSAYRPFNTNSQVGGFMGNYASFVDVDRQLNLLKAAEFKTLEVTPDLLTQTRLRLESPEIFTVKEINWPEFYITDSGGRILVEARDAQLVITQFGTADFSATIKDQWLATSYLFRVVLFHDVTRLEVLETIGKRYYEQCGNAHRDWSARFDYKKFDAVNGAQIVAEGYFDQCS